MSFCNVKIKVFGKYRSCISKHIHGGQHTPDLTGICIGRARIIKEGKPFLCKNGRYRTSWIVRYDDGTERRTCAAYIINGVFLGEISKSNFSQKNGKICPIYSTISGHHRCIFKPRNSSTKKSYKNMPFFADWNPDKDGAFWKGVKWIKENLGARHNGDHLHIIDRKIGFWPGNLVWVPASKHKREEMINKLLLENKNLRDQLARVSCQTRNKSR